ncbi:MAG: hypothetical protein GVX78_02245, partial [Bacteroidetes bacterium]|nr:hypothetical protein [Bacteroidota bacterium]
LGNHLVRQAIQDPEIRALLNTYTEGVNHIVNQLSTSAFPLEYKLLRYEPEPWTIAHSGSVAASLVHNLCFRNEDLENSNIIQSFGEAFFDKYYPAWNPRQTPIIQEHPTAQGNQISGKTNTISYQPLHKVTQPDASNGSNNWAVHRSKTSNNRNLLANDPHLGLSLPSLWYELHIHLPEKQIYGVSFPGIPGIVLGFNDKIAWGSTNVSHDVADWLKPIWKSHDSFEYFFEGEWLEAEMEKEIIYVRDQDSVVINIPQTRLGRIPYPDNDHALSRLAFYWGALQTEGANLFKTFIGFNKANNYSAFKSALKHFTFPAQNFVFADRSDTIAMHVQGHLPLRSRGTGAFVQDSMSEPVFKSRIPQESLPHEVNPKRAFVSSANQHSTFPSYPYFYRGYFDGFRGRTLDSLLRTNEQISFNDMETIQLSNFSMEAKEALPMLISQLSKTDHPNSENLSMLKEWDFNYRANSKAATLFSMWWNEFQNIVYQPLNLEKLPDSWRLIQLMEDHPLDTLFYLNSDSSIRGLPNITAQSFLAASKKYENQERKSWFEYKSTAIPHLGKIDAFSTSILNNGGTRNALNAVKRNHGPSWRMIVEMGDTIKARGIYPGGQSGNPGSHFYENFVSMGNKGQINNMRNLLHLIALIILVHLINFMLDPRWCWAILILYGFIIRQNRWQGFLLPFFAVLVSWVSYCLYLDFSNQHLLAEKMGGLLNGIPAFSLPWISALIGAIGGGLCGWVGTNFQKLLSL